MDHSTQMIKTSVRFFLLISTTVFTAAAVANAQDSFFDRWEARTTATQLKQPNWTPPVVTTYVGLIQVLRSDFTRQYSPTRETTWNFDTSKGLDLIPWANTEIDINLPPFLHHSAATPKDGAGDMSFQLKYRFLTGDAESGNYIVGACLTSTIPTGSYKNGSSDASVTPTLLLGKGFGRLDVQSQLGGNLPTGDTGKLGRPVTWNTTAQYHLGKYLWPEIEDNSTFYHGGPNDGKMQNFLTPGIVFSKFSLRPRDAKSRLGVGFGAGEQIATSAFHSYNHGLVFTGRLVF
jgi:hypothetical protein